MQFQHFSLQELAIYEIVIPDAPMLCIKTIITCKKKDNEKRTSNVPRGRYRICGRPSRAKSVPGEKEEKKEEEETQIRNA